MPLGGMLLYFIGYVLDKEVSRNAIVAYRRNIYNIWLFIMRYVAPISVFIIMLKEMGIITI
ncbi:MAG: hypothetical protein U5K55_04675 [Aliarcobacter sp.]|nr:hypothetical protein [Aliarcobacter sp.]